MKYIRVNENYKVKVDKYGNHQVVQFQEGGKIIERGKFKGRVTEDKWVELDSYHANLALALKKISYLMMLEDSQEEVGVVPWMNRMENILNEFKNTTFKVEE